MLYKRAFNHWLWGLKYLLPKTYARLEPALYISYLPRPLLYLPNLLNSGSCLWSGGNSTADSSEGFRPGGRVCFCIRPYWNPTLDLLNCLSTLNTNWLGLFILIFSYLAEHVFSTINTFFAHSTIYCHMACNYYDWLNIHVEHCCIHKQ